MSAELTTSYGARSTKIMENTAPECTSGVSAENTDFPTSFVPQYLFTALTLQITAPLRLT